MDRGTERDRRRRAGVGRHLDGTADSRFQSKVYPTTDLNEFLAQDSYAVWNASLTYRAPTQRWQLALYGQNLGDKAYRTTGYDFPTLGIRTGYYGPPRTAALAITYYFR